MKALRIFLLILIILGVGLLIAERLWVPPFVAQILKYEGSPAIVAPSTGIATTTDPTKPALLPKGLLHGKVLLSRTCPVERMPPDPACAPKGYQTTIRIEPLGSSAPAMTISSDASGAFSISLVAGTYTLKPQGGIARLPSCPETQVTILVGKTQNMDLNCDTGIR